MDVPGDPSPAWHMCHPGLLKIFPPAELERYVDKDYAGKVAALFQARCEVLRRLRSKAAYIANEPHLLPAACFTGAPSLAFVSKMRARFPPEMRHNSVRTPCDFWHSCF